MQNHFRTVERLTSYLAERESFIGVSPSENDAFMQLLTGILTIGSKSLFEHIGIGLWELKILMVLGSGRACSRAFVRGALGVFGVRRFHQGLDKLVCDGHVVCIGKTDVIQPLGLGQYSYPTSKFIITKSGVKLLRDFMRLIKSNKARTRERVKAGKRGSRKWLDSAS